MSDHEAKRILDVGCGLNKYPNAIGLDYNPKTGADVIHDLAVVPYPFEDNEFDVIVCLFDTQFDKLSRGGFHCNRVACQCREGRCCFVNNCCCTSFEKIKNQTEIASL